MSSFEPVRKNLPKAFQKMQTCNEMLVMARNRVDANEAIIRIGLRSYTQAELDRANDYLRLAIAESNILDMALVYWRQIDAHGGQAAEVRGGQTAEARDCQTAEACGGQAAEVRGGQTAEARDGQTAEARGGQAAEAPGDINKVNFQLD